MPAHSKTLPHEPRASTGISGLDNVLHGGLPGGHLYLFEGEPGMESTNPMGAVHGGWALTLIDSACGCAAHTTLPQGLAYTSLETKVNFTRPIFPSTGVVRAEGRSQEIFEKYLARRKIARRIVLSTPHFMSIATIIGKRIVKTPPVVMTFIQMLLGTVALLPLMQHKDVVLGLGDGGAHYAAICDASYSTFLLTYWTRDRAGEKIDWASAVRALTFTPADTMCLSDRGLLKPGYKADVNVIDAERLALHRPEVKFDLPTGGRRLDQAATGYDWTICSGEVIRQNDRSTGARPGRLVRGSQQPPMAA